MRVRALLFAGLLVVAGGAVGTAQASTTPATNSQSTWACGGLDPVGGVCIDSPLAPVTHLVDGLAIP